MPRTLLKDRKRDLLSRVPAPEQVQQCVYRQSRWAGRCCGQLYTRPPALHRWCRSAVCQSGCGCKLLWGSAREWGPGQPAPTGNSSSQLVSGDQTNTVTWVCETRGERRPCANQYFIPQLCYLSGVSAMPVISYAICDKSKVHSHQRSWLKAFCWLLVGFGPLSSSNWGLILWEDKILNVKYIWRRSFLEHRTKLQVREWRHISDLVGQSGISDICALQCCVCTNCPDVRVPCTFMCGISPVCFNLSSSSNQKLITLNIFQMKNFGEQF